MKYVKLWAISLLAIILVGSASYWLSVRQDFAYKADGFTLWVYSILTMLCAAGLLIAWRQAVNPARTTLYMVLLIMLACVGGLVALAGILGTLVAFIPLGDGDNLLAGVKLYAPIALSAGYIFILSILTLSKVESA